MLRPRYLRLGQVREALAPFDDAFFAERSLVRVLSRASAGGASLADFLRCDGALVPGPFQLGECDRTMSQISKVKCHKSPR